jgi:hypothetical protein
VKILYAKFVTEECAQNAMIMLLKTPMGYVIAITDSMIRTIMDPVKNVTHFVENVMKI